MKKLLIIAFVFSTLVVKAQVKTPNQNNKPVTNEKSSEKKTTIKGNQKPLSDSAINPIDGHNHGDTIKINVPKDNGFNPSNPKLKNSKVKTPVYNNQVTGTNAPGDVNTGISADNSMNHLPPNNATKDSTKGP